MRKFKKSMTAWRSALRAHSHGFQLIEVGIVLAISGLFIASILQTMESLRADTEKQHDGNQLHIAEISLKTFLLKMHRLPCPDLTGSGYEGNERGECPGSASSGGLPYKTLHIEGMEGTNINRLAYAVWKSVSGIDQPSNGVAEIAAADKLLLLKMNAGMSERPETWQPFYILGDHSDCQGVKVNAVFIVASPEALNGGGCFHEQPKSGRMIAIGMPELFGWIYDQMRL